MDLSNIDELFQSLGKYAQKEFGFKRPPTLNLVSDEQNQMKLLGKTAYYDPQNMSISIYVDGRHSKDILRSFAHELVHHTQNENGKLDIGGYSGEGYAQKNKNLRNMERDAYERGNMCFRDWEDQLKQEKPTIYSERRNYKMSTKKWKNKELSEILSERFGIKMNLSALNESKDSEDEGEDYKQGYSDAMAGHEMADDAPRGGGYRDGYEAGEKERLEQDAKAGRDIKDLKKENLKDPKKADLDKDGKITNYEKKRGEAIEKSIEGDH